MYCIILHGVPPERFLSAPPQLPASQKSSQRGARIPDNILYVNPDCALQILIDYIKKELKIGPYDEIDFCNLNGDLLHIEDSEPALNASNLFEPFAKYICVLKHRSDDGILAKLTPLVANSYSEISLKLRRHVRLSKRLSYELKLRSDKENEFIIPTSYNINKSASRLRIRSTDKTLRSPQRRKKSKPSKR